jgi:tRNA(Ile)-lysidine synthase
MQLLETFKSFINKEDLFSPKERLLVAVSGGLDSVVLCDLCYQAGYEFAIAHANFQLRGEESMRDETFVAGLGQRYGKEVLVRRFDTSRYAAENKCSIQVAARELRYRWFEEVHDGPILTAHHQDDNIETLLMNFFKGTGIAGLRAMLPRQGNIVRPLLFATREMLRQFAGGQGLAWVEDSSNASDKYTRNYFRHQLIPMLQTIYPDVMKNLGDNINRFREVEVLYKQAVEQQKRRLLEQKGDEVHIPVLKLQRSKPLSTLVYEIIRDFGFSAQQAPAVMGLLDSGPGKYVMSDTHRILKDRNWLIISPHKAAPADHVLVEQGQKKVLFGEGALEFQLLTGVAPSSDPSVAWLDASAIQYPLLLRKWRPGDYFYPLGMRKKKKLARFFIDNKLSLARKEKAWVLEMNKKIIWVVGMRIDDRYRLGERTEQILKISFIPSGGEDAGRHGSER